MWGGGGGAEEGGSLLAVVTPASAGLTHLLREKSYHLRWMLIWRPPQD